MLAVIFVFNLSSCINKNQNNNNEIQNETNGEASEIEQESHFLSQLSSVLAASQLPLHISQRIQSGVADTPSFILDLFSILQTDPYIWILVDKKNPLPHDYEPDDLIELNTILNRSYNLNREGMLLRKAAADSLEIMAAAAKKEGLALLVSSTYRSYEYQAAVYERNVRVYGQEAADMESAKAGHSQHQLGLAVDFGSITDAFADTAQGIWLAANASRFGWSLSYPRGYEEITGYRWESWHYRYVGIEISEFIDTYFDGIQQHALEFLHQWQLFAQQ